MPGLVKDWDALTRSGKLEGLKVGELKEYCKQHGLVQAGEKGTLMFRIKAHVEGKSLLVDGKNPANLKPAELKKACATRGLSPMGYPDELLEALMGYLKKHGAAGASAKGDEKGEGGGDEGDAAVALASRILELSEEDKWSSILSLGGQEVTRTSPTPLLRRAYLQLSRIVHPDRLQHFSQATQAFQALVTAFERLTSPEEVDTEEDNRRDGRGQGRQKVRTISRSNEGCFRTTVLCPRCKEEWGTPVQGLPPYAYNYFMTGLKTYCCSTCLLEFGALTATHLCPFCRKAFDYDPEDYHRKITCPNRKCGRDFGFVLHAVSDRVEKEMRTQLKLELEQRLKARESKLARLARSHKRKDASGVSDDDARLKERIFIQACPEEAANKADGLADACPRCGEVMECASDDVEAHREHLKGCRDKGKIEAHHKRQKMQQAREAERAEKEQQQEDLRSLRTWEFLGADDGTLWLLSEEQLAKQCQNSGLKVDKGAGKDQTVARLMEHRRGSQGRLLTDGTQLGRRGGGGARRPFSRDSLPTNLHAMSLAQLRAVCAAHGFTPKATTAAGVVKEIEAEMARGDEDQVFLITG